MAYLELNFNEVKGYNKLSQGAKTFFERTYKVHNAVQGTDYKEDYTPVEVEEFEKYLKVHFKNNIWLHYYANGTWG